MADAQPTDARARGAKFRKLAHVTLMEDCNNSADVGNAVVIGTRVSEKAISRSGLLSGIEHAAGLASLPAHLSPEDVKLWEVACSVEVEFPSDELVTVLKVADALGDTRDAVWLETLATRAAATDWGAKTGERMLAALLRLHPHLLTRVLSACLSHKPLKELIVTLPPALHPDTLAAAAAADSGTLDLGSTTGPPKSAARGIANALTALPHAAIPSPGLLRLVLSMHDSTPLRQPTATGALLARAASAHPSITSLALRYGAYPPQLFRSFLACLTPGALPRLVHLFLVTHSNPDGCAEVAACLRRLPALTSLDVSFSLKSDDDAQTPAEVSLSSYARLTAAPASLPHLRRLVLAEGIGRRIGMSVRRAACANTLLPLVSAPAVTYLGLSVCAAFAVADVWSQTARYPGLRALHIDCENLYAGEADRHPFAGAAWTAAEDVAPNVPPVTEVTIEGECMPSMHATAAALTATLRDTLTSLTMRAKSDCFGLASAFCRAGKEVALERLPSLLSCCSELRSLDFAVLCALREDRRWQLSDGLATGLMAMPQLTRLSMREAVDQAETSRAVVLHSTPLGDAISSLAQLAVLSVVGENVEFYNVQVLVDACAGLERLSHVAVCFRGVTEAHIESILKAVPSLAQLTLCKRTLDVLESDNEGYEALFGSHSHVEVCSA